MNEQLKLCPRCCSSHVELDYDPRDIDYECNPCVTYFVKCNKCEYSTKRYIYDALQKGDKVAIEAWNKRHA